VSKANEDFREQFAEVGTRLEMFADDAQLAQRCPFAAVAPVQVAVKEIRTCREQGADTSSVSAATIEAIRCSMDGVRTRENQAAQLQTLDPVQRHRRRPVHRPARHRAGDHGGVPRHRHGRRRQHQRHRPGMAAALLATAMGLFVAIPALFGYNRLITRNKEVSADMRVFVDEFITRLAEMHGEGQSSEAAHQRGHHANHLYRPEEHRHGVRKCLPRR
jgi:biopolymer transport protein ExbB